MPESNECKGCQASVRLSDEEIKKIFGDMVKVKSVKLVTEDVYRRRLDACRACVYLDYGTTCRQCSCVVQIKAKLQAASCPYPFNPKW